MSLESVTEEWLQGIDRTMGPLMIMALRAQLEWETASYSMMAAETVGLGGGAILAGGLPVVTMAGVFVALGSGYYQAREMAREENNLAGFSQGFVTGLLGWQWPHVTSRLGRWGVLRINQFDEAINVIRVNAYNTSLKAGYVTGGRLAPDQKRAYLTTLRKLAGHPSAGAWTQRDQINFVIDLASAGLRSGLIKAG